MKYGKKFLIAYLLDFLSENKNPTFELEYINKIPNKFYRFRTCNENDLKAIQEGYIWLSIASEFNDIKDSTLKFNFCLQKESILNVYFDWYPYILKNELHKNFPKIDFSRISLNRELFDEFRENSLNRDGSYNRKKLKRYMISVEMSNKEYEFINKYLESLLSQEHVEKISSQIVNDFNQKMKRLKDDFFVTCFTETYKNDNLWETYAKRYTGFCIEYDLSTVEENIKVGILTKFAPIIYGFKKPIDFINIFKIAKKQYCNEDLDSQVLRDYDVQFNIQYRTKSITYAHEKEWRFYCNKEMVDSRKYNFPYISKIYLGKDIKSRNKSRIVNIARKLEVEVYQQEFNQLLSSFSYRKILK